MRKYICVVLGKAYCEFSYNATNYSIILLFLFHIRWKRFWNLPIVMPKSVPMEFCLLRLHGSKNWKMSQAANTHPISCTGNRQQRQHGWPPLGGNRAWPVPIHQQHAGFLQIQQLGRTFRPWTKLYVYKIFNSRYNFSRNACIYLVIFKPQSGFTSLLYFCL